MANIPTRGITSFKSKLSGGGARPNLFEVEVAFPGGINDAIGVTGTFDAEKFRFLCKGAALPASNVAPIDVPFRGRILKVAGDRTFDTWTVTVINDEDFNIRNSFERWMQNIAQYENHSGLTDPFSYMGNATVYQLGRTASTNEIVSTSSTNSKVLAQYKFVDIFPTNISQIDLSYDTSDTIEEFTVEFQINYFYPESPTTSTNN